MGRSRSRSQKTFDSWLSLAPRPTNALNGPTPPAAKETLAGLQMLRAPTAPCRSSPSRAWLGEEIFASRSAKERLDCALVDTVTRISRDDDHDVLNQAPRYLVREKLDDKALLTFGVGPCQAKARCSPFRWTALPYLLYQFRVAPVVRISISIMYADKQPSSSMDHGKAAITSLILRDLAVSVASKSGVHPPRAAKHCFKTFVPNPLLK